MFPVLRPTGSSWVDSDLFFNISKKKLPVRDALIQAAFIFRTRLIFGDSVYSTKMVASYIWRSVVMAIKLHKCDHLETKSFMISVRNSKLI